MLHITDSTNAFIGLKQWYYSATDMVRSINNETYYVKAGNYWRWLKTKLAAMGIQPVSDTHEMKLVAPDGRSVWQI